MQLTTSIYYFNFDFFKLVINSFQVVTYKYLMLNTPIAVSIRVVHVIRLQTRFVIIQDEQYSEYLVRISSYFLLKRSITSFIF